MKRKAYALAMAAVLTTMSLAGSAQAVMAEEEVTLTVWGDLDNQVTLENSFEAANEAFEEAHPNIKIDYQWTGTFDNINVAVQSDSLPDLFWVQGNKSTKMAELARNGYIRSLDDVDFDKERHPQACVEYSTVDGSVYCNYPGFFDYATVYYNKDLFEENGIAVPETFADFDAAVKAFAEKGITPIALGGSGEWDRYWFAQIVAPAVANDTLSAIKNHEEVDYTGMETLFDMFAEYSANGYFGKDFQATDNVGAQLSFTNGKAAMTMDGTWAKDIYKDLEFEVGAFAMPDENGVRYSQSGESNVNTYAMSTKCEHPEEAAEYLKFLSSQEAEQIFEDNNGGIPLVKDVEVSDEIVKDFTDFDEVGRNIYHVLAGVADENGKPQDSLMGEILPKLMTGDMTGAEGVEIVKAEIEKSANK